MRDDRDFDADAPSDVSSTDLSEAVMAGNLEASHMALRDDGSVAAQEILQTISQLMNTLNTERKVVLVAEERRREALIELAKVQGELEAERQLRKRAEEELQRLRDEHAERRKRAEAELARLRSRKAPDALPPTQAPPSAHETAVGEARDPGRDELERALSDEQTRRREVEAQLAHIDTSARERRGRAREELDRRRHHGAPEELVQRAKSGLERVLGENLDEEPRFGDEHLPEPQAESGPERLQPVREDLSDIWTPDTSLATEEQAAKPNEGDAIADSSEAPPLPPEWRYASDAPPSPGRRRFRLRWRPR